MKFKLKSKKQIFFFLIIITILITGNIIFTSCNLNLKNNSVNNTNSKTLIQATNFTLKDLNNNDVSLFDFKGNIIVLNFWATWCPPCKAEIPDFVEVYKTYKDKGVSFLGVSVDEDLNALKQFALDYNINYTVVVDNKNANIASKWNVTAIPTTYFIDKNGNIVDWNIGQISKSQLISKLNSLINMK